MPPKQPTRRQSTISFYGQDIVAYQELDPNETYVPIVRLCADVTPYDQGWPSPDPPSP